MQLTRKEFEKLLQTRPPSPEEMGLINQFAPLGSEPWESSELIRFCLLASNNLIHASLMAWDETAIDSMVASYPGCPLMLDHEWENGLKTFGMVYDALIYSLPRVSESGLKRILEKSPNPEMDREIINKNGYHQVLIFGFCEKSHPITSDILYGRRANVSVGGFFYGEPVCPTCETPYSNEKCPHYPPYMAGWVDDSLLTQYYRRVGKFKSIECSFVYAGNCEQARLIDSRPNSFVLS